MLTLTALKREILGKTNKRLPKDKMAAVFYGPKEKSTSILLSKGDFKKIWKEAGESTVISIKEGNQEHEALIHEVTFDPISSEPIHADFYIIEKGKKVEVPVQIHFEGDSPAVRDLGGVLIKVLHEIEVEAFPKDLPHSIVVDISVLSDFESQIKVKDIKLPQGVSVLNEQEDVVAAIGRPHEEKEEEAAPVDLSSIEVEKKGKKEEEGALPEGATPEGK